MAAPTKLERYKKQLDAEQLKVFLELPISQQTEMANNEIKVVKKEKKDKSIAGSAANLLNSYNLFSSEITKNAHLLSSAEVEKLKNKFNELIGNFDVIIDNNKKKEEKIKELEDKKREIEKEINKLKK